MPHINQGRGRIHAVLGALGLALAVPAATYAQQVPAPDVSALAVPADLAASTDARISPLLLKAKGQVNVWVQMQTPALAVEAAKAKESGLPLTRGAQRAHLSQIDDEHNTLSRAVVSLGGRELGRVSKAHNAVAFSMPAANLSALAAQPGVLTIRPVIDYHLDGNPTAETVPYIADHKQLGVTGEGVRVAVLDSGIDYTHQDLGGSGNVSDYIAAYGTETGPRKPPQAPSPNTLLPSTDLYPTSKVVGGYDFVGEQWPNGPLAPDPNPIACGIGVPVTGAPTGTTCDGTHGTHVADIIAGASTDGIHKGVAPGALLYAVKVCSSVSTACSGVALIQGMDFALDPNGDNHVDDAVDVINMSLGSNYGQFEDDLSNASENATRLGVVVACAAGNAGDHPYIVSSPSTAPGAISVAQTQVPSAMFYPIRVNTPANIGPFTNTATVDWAPVGNGFTGDVVFVGKGCPGDTYLANPSGKVALIDRGTCAVSLKVDGATSAGAIGILIGLVAPGDPFSFSFGGGMNFAPTLVITQSDSNKLKTALASGTVNVTVDPSLAGPLVGSMVSGSARGPSYSYQTIKPEIGAPGASVSAVAGTGTFEAAFGGTSGATPMVAGSAALLLEAFPHASPAEIKARLMNNTETQIKTAPNVFGDQLAPATRIGAGEVRVDRALAATTVAWVPEDETAAISFGAPSLSQPREFHKRVVVYNASNTRRSYFISKDFRVPNSEKAAEFTLPSSINVGPRSFREIDVRVRIDPTQLPAWTLNGGSRGGDGPEQTNLELDGHLTVQGGADTVKLPWSVLPHRAANVTSNDEVELTDGKGSLQLRNNGATGGRVEIFAWTGSSKKLARRLLPKPGDNFAIIDLGQVGVRAAGSAVQFAINSFGKRAHPNYPAEFDISVDVNNDGTPDFVVFNSELGGFGATGQNVVSVVNLTTNSVGTFFYTDADLNSSTAILTAPLSALAGTITVTKPDGSKTTTPGALATDKPFGFSIYAFDNYFTGNLTDAIEGMTFTLGSPRFTASGVPAAGVPVGGRTTLTVDEVKDGAAASPSQRGLLLLYRDAANREAQTVSVSADDNG